RQAPKLPASPPRGSVVELDESGLPFIRGHADAPALHMSLAELIALEQAAQAEEDARRAGFPV
ncbi:MAG: hypothetical protein ACYC1J_11480, partial [Acidithiobacillus ferrooxidans]